MRKLENKEFNSLEQLFTEASGSSKLATGRSKLTTAQICSYDRLTMRDFDLIEYFDEQEGKEVSYPIIIFDEIEDGYYCGGQALSDVCHALRNNEALWNELRERGIPLRFEELRTRSGNSYVNFIVLSN